MIIAALRLTPACTRPWGGRVRLAWWRCPAICESVAFPCLLEARSEVEFWECGVDRGQSWALSGAGLRLTLHRHKGCLGSIRRRLGVHPGSGAHLGSCAGHPRWIWGRFGIDPLGARSSSAFDPRGSALVREGAHLTCHTTWAHPGSAQGRSQPPGALARPQMCAPLPSSASVGPERCLAPRLGIAALAHSTRWRGRELLRRGALAAPRGRSRRRLVFRRRLWGRAGGWSARIDPSVGRTSAGLSRPAIDWQREVGDPKATEKTPPPANPASSKAVQKVPRRLSNSCRESAPGDEIRPELNPNWPMFASIGEHWRTLAKFWPMSAFGPVLADVGQRLAQTNNTWQIQPIRKEVGKCCQSCQAWQLVGRHRPKCSHLGRIWYPEQLLNNSCSETVGPLRSSPGWVTFRDVSSNSVP